MSRFDGQTVIVAGGARGMGASHARGFAGEGANVVIADVRRLEGSALADELDRQAIFSVLDVTSESDWDRTVAAAEEAFGPISVLVNNAGMRGTATIEESAPDRWRREINVNLTGRYLGIRAVIASMHRAGAGSIVNVSSVGGLTGAAGCSAYVASTWAIRGLTKSAALELGQDNIRVNSVHPGYTRTPMSRGDLDGYPAEELAIQRVAEPHEITRLVLFVASADAAFCTGTEFIADGGWLLGPAMATESGDG